MGGPERAPHTPRCSATPRRSRGAPRSGDVVLGGLERAPQTPQRSDAPRHSRGAPRFGDAVSGGPEMAASALPGGLSRPGGAGALIDILRAPGRYSRMVSNWNLQ